MSELTLFEQIARALNAPIRQVHERPLSEAAYIDTDPPTFCRAGGWGLDGKMEVGINWPTDTRDRPRGRNYSDSRPAGIIAKAIQRDVLAPNAERYAEELARRAKDESIAEKRIALANELAALAGAPHVHNHGFSLPGRSGTAEVGVNADRVYIELYSVSLDQAKRIIEALKEDE